MEELIRSVRWNDLLDIGVMAFLTYRVLLLIKGTRALQMLWGILLLVPINYIATALSLDTISSILDRFAGYLVLAIIILFQDDIRRALARVGNPLFPDLTKQEETQILEEMQRSVFAMASEHVGAIIVIEREGNLSEYIDVGTRIEARVSNELLTAIFQTSSPIHDGAVIIQKDRVAAAGCFLPLTTNPEVSKALGTRHRAAIGLTETNDSVAMVVSEEEGRVSLVVAGKIKPMPDANALREELQKHFNLDPQRRSSLRIGSFSS